LGHVKKILKLGLPQAAYAGLSAVWRRLPRIGRTQVPKRIN